MRKLLIISVLVAICKLTFAQQLPHFNQNREHGFMINPAVSATYLRSELKFSFRKQWLSTNQSPITQTLSFIAPLDRQNMGIGAVLVNDQAGAIGYTGLYLNLSYMIRFDKSRKYNYAKFLELSKIAMGASIGAIQYRLKAEELLVTDANDPVILNASASTWTPDVGVGINYSIAEYFYLGAGIPQLYSNVLDFSEVDDEFTLLERVPHFYILTGGLIPLGEKWSLAPSIWLKMVKNAPTNGNFSLRLKLNDLLWLGGSYRTSKEVSLAIGIEVLKNTSISYNLETFVGSFSGQAGTSHEFVVAYKLGEERNTKSKKRRRR